MKKISPKHIHFMGIGGSAASGVAIMAKKSGYEVDGCDLEANSPYLGKVKKEGIRTFKGHSANHLRGIDILAASPAIVYQNKSHPEFKTAKKLGIFCTWDEFVGRYLLIDKETICITGTHGKSTVSSIAAQLFEKANMDPSAIIGASVKEWNANFKVGKGRFFIIEADDFYEKFLSYHPSTIILNNIEFDHPDYFKSENHMVSSYSKFIKLLEGSKNLIVNQDSYLVKKLLSRLETKFLKSINLYGYSLEKSPAIQMKNSYRATISETSPKKTVFTVTERRSDQWETYQLSIPGIFNVSNSMGVIILGRIFGIDEKIIKNTLYTFSGTGRRLEMIGEKSGVKVYDDYAHHPTAIKVTLEALRQKYPEKKILAIIEPHSYSRTKALLSEYKGIFSNADEVMVGPIFKARDLKTFGMSGNSILKVAGHKNSIYLPDLKKIISFLKKNIEKGDVIIVMGAGYSYKWAREILRNLN